MRIALITGASSGLGEEFIRQIQDYGIDEIWAVARRKDRLEAIAAASEVPVRALALDLTRQESIGAIERLIRSERPDIRLLINAAGFGKIGSYQEISREDVDSMIDLNCRAAVDLTLISIPYMGKGSHILEICSTAAFQPFQFLNVYAASKAFLYRFSRALRFELWRSGITITAVCPYWIKNTEFIPVAEKSRGGGEIHSFPFSSKKESVVKRALTDARLRLPVSTPGVMCTIHRFAAKFIPSFIMCHIWNAIRHIPARKQEELDRRKQTKQA